MLYGWKNKCDRKPEEYLAQNDMAIMQLGFSFSLLSNEQQYVVPCAHFSL